MGKSYKKTKNITSNRLPLDAPTVSRYPTPPQKMTKQAVASFIQTITRLQRSNWKKELEDWSYARVNARNVKYPRRYYLYQLYDDIKIDMFIRGQLNQRYQRIKNRKFKIVNAAGETDIEKTKLLNKKWFKNFMIYALNSKFYGYSLINLMVDPNGNFTCSEIYREHVVPEDKLILKSPFDAQGVRFDEEPFKSFLIPVGDSEDLGIFESLAVGYILKKHSWQSWDEFEELFGIPIRWAKTASTDNDVQNEIKGWLEDMGQAAYGLFPMDTEIEIKENSKTDSFQVFNKKREAVNEEAAILINGQHESSNDSGSRAKSETIMNRTQDEITDDDKGDIRDVINDELLPRLAQFFGFPFLDTDKFEWDDAKQLPLKDLADIMKTVSDMGFKIDPDEISSKLGISVFEPDETNDDDEKTDPVPGSKKKKDKKPAATLLEHVTNMHLEINELLNHSHA
jgi:hypothetical protein